jgi:uracil-DNA glycosylase
VSVVHARLADDDDRDGFWAHAHAFLADRRAPADIVWSIGGDHADLFAAPAQAHPHPRPAPVETTATALLDKVILHSDPDRFALAYRILSRLRANPSLAEVLSDPDIARARSMEKAVRRDMHKMTAFVRFRRLEDSEPETYAAWFEPTHHIVQATAPFFVRRFFNMRWSILAPRRTARWDGQTLTFAPGANRSSVPQDDPLEDVWRTYYAQTFNPARLNVDAMRAEMPKKYWHNLPEAALIQPLVRAAQERTRQMVAAPASTPRRGAKSSPAAVASALESCTRCPLHAHATQVVPGEGPPHARLLIVGEQPGDHEDIAGKPFVGPAGNLLDEALRRAGLVREDCYLTNAVKHFKFEPRGKRRIHKSPLASEIDACRFWLDQERARLQPQITLALGATAARGILGRSVSVTEVRSTFWPLPDGSELLVTVHPAYLLRLTGEDNKRQAWRAFMADLTMVRDRLASRPAKPGP